MNKLKSVLVCCLLMFTFFITNAQNIGYINSQQVIALMPDVKEANSNLETYSAQLKKRAEQMYQSLEKKAAGLQAKKEAGEISPKQMEVELANLQTEEQKLVEFQGKSQSEIANKQAELLEPILKKVQDAIDAVAKEKGLTYVFDSSQGMILYAEENTDIGPAVQSKLGLK